MEDERVTKRRAVHVMTGTRLFALNERQHEDFYRTEPKRMELLLEMETFDHNVWECACGQGHLSKVLEEHGYNVRSTDLVDRGYGEGGVDFLAQTETWDGDIITNPPYKYGMEFVEKRIELVPEGHKVCMFLKLQFLESVKRRKLFDKYPPKIVYISSNRLKCAINGDFSRVMKYGAICFCWFVWEKGFTGDPIIKWFN